MNKKANTFIDPIRQQGCSDTFMNISQPVMQTEENALHECIFLNEERIH